MPQNEKESGARKERIRELLREAFADVPCPYKEVDIDGLNHEIYHEVCKELNVLTSEGVHFYLPRILEDFLDCETNQSASSEELNLVVRYLNGNWNESGFEWLRDHAGEDVFDAAVKEQKHLSEQKEKTFAHFNNDQALAIHAWLLFVRNSQKTGIHLRELDGAINYWEKRSR
jgi:hypothetical protein